ncbi:MAG: PilN domain-containing protein [Candidatus Firestonebacteria bacterium]
MFRNKVDIVELDGKLLRLISVKKEKDTFSLVRAEEVVNYKPGGIKIGPEFGLLYPREQCLIRELLLKGSEAEIAAAVKKEADESLPYDRDEVLWDAETISASGSDKTVLFAAASEETVRKYTGLLGLKSHAGISIFPTTLALYELLRMNKVDFKEPSVALYLSSERADLLICGKGSIKFSRGWKLAEKVEALSEVKQAVEAFARAGTTVKKAFSNSKELNTLLASAGFETSLLTLPSGLSSELKTAGVEPSGFGLLAGTAAAALDLGAVRLDLNRNKIESGIKPDTLLLVKKISYVLSAALLFFSLVFFWLSKNSEAKTEACRIELSRLGALSGKPWSQVLTKLYKAVPDGAVLNELSSDIKGEVTLRGVAVSRASVTALLENLNKAPGFAAELGFANEINTGSKQAVQFQMKIRQRMAE